MTHLDTTFDERDTAHPTGGQTPRSAHIFVLLECDRPLAGGARYAASGVETISLGRAPERAAHRPGARQLDIGIPDGWMSRDHARIERVMNRWILEDRGSRNGTSVNGSRVDRAELRDGDVLELGHTLVLFREALPTPIGTPAEAETPAAPDTGAGLTTLIPELEAEFRALERIARGGVEVLIRGESGTGKELVARAIHELSSRSGAFVAINCGAIPASLVESELFGHEKGAFSGADRPKKGLVRSADGGTLFLDEIGDLAAESQAALLRALQEREVTPVGGAVPISVDFRLLSATHHDLERNAERGAFREDLLGRLAAHTVHLPALRERREDFGVLVAALMARLASEREPPAIATDAARLLLAHPFPRNIRQLEKTLAVALSLADGDRLEAHHLPAEIRTPAPREASPAQANTSAPSPAKRLGEADRARAARIEALLRDHDGNISAVARAMGKGRTQIQRWIQRYDIDVQGYRRE
jgi:DNA-binding NtrC family response regulator